jgi:hypothetical protein
VSESPVGAVALYTVLWSVVAIGNGHFQHLAEQNPLNRSKQKFVQLITWAGPPSRPKIIMIGRGIAAPHMGEVVDWRSFFPVTSRASAQPSPNARVPHQSTRFRPRMCLLGVSSIRLIPSFWGRQWGFLA